MRSSLMKYASLMMAMILMLTVCAGAAADQEKRKMENASNADEWMTAFLGDHPEALDGVWLMTSQMEAAAALSGGIGGLAKQMSALGKAEKILSAYEEELQGYKAFRVPCIFSAAQVDLLLIVQDGAIAGLQTGAYTGDTEEVETESDSFDSIRLLGRLSGLAVLWRSGSTGRIHRSILYLQEVTRFSP